MNSVGNKKRKKEEDYLRDNKIFLAKVKIVGTAFVTATIGAIIVFAMNHGSNFSTNAPEKELDSTKVVTQNTDKEFENRINEDSTIYQIDDNTIAVEDNKTDEKEDKGILETIKDVFSNKDKDNEQTTNDTNSSNTNNESTTHNEQTNEFTQSENVSPTNNTRNPVTGSVETHVATSRDATLLGVGGEVTFHGDKTDTSVGVGLDKTVSHNPSKVEGLNGIEAWVDNTTNLENGDRFNVGAEANVNLTNSGSVEDWTVFGNGSYEIKGKNSNNAYVIGVGGGYNSKTGPQGVINFTVKLGNPDTEMTYVDNGSGFKLVEKNTSATPDNPNPSKPNPSKPNINTPNNPREPVR